jgi:fatty acid desaturase
MFPVVPYHALAKLHEAIKHDLPPPTPSIIAGYREMIPIWLRQLKGEDVFLRKELPPTAKPYREDLQVDAPMSGSGAAE